MNQNQRNETLSQEQINQLKGSPHIFKLNEKEFLLYNLVQKESNSGLFNNTRLLILNTKTEQFGYLSKIPNRIIPFQHEDQIKNLQFKEIINVYQIYQNGENKANCSYNLDRYSINIRINKSSLKIQWIYFFKTKELMKLWYQHLQFLFTRNREAINQKYHNIPTKQEPQQNQIEKSQHIGKFQPQKDKETTINVGLLNPVNNNKHEDENLQQIKSEKLIQKSIKHSILQSDKNQDVQQQQKFNTILEDIQIKLRNAHKQQIFIGDLGQQFEIKKEQSRNQRQSHANEFSEGDPIVKFVREQDQQEKMLNIPMGQVYISKNNNKSKQPSLNNVSSQDKRQIITQNRSKIRDRKPQLKQTAWNNLYYSNKQNSVFIYFDFIKECKNQVTSLIDNLPIDNRILSSQSQTEYFMTESKGITFKILLASDDVQSNKTDTLKRQFYENRNVFFEDESLRPELICYVQYKGVAVYCQAISLVRQNRVEMQNKSIVKAHDNQRKILSKMVNLQLHITSSSDFQDIMRYLEIYKLDWAFMYKNCDINIFKNQFLNQIYSEIFVNLIKIELSSLYQNFPIKKQQQIDPKQAQTIILDSILMFINQLFSTNQQGEELWQNIIKETEVKYHIKSSRESVIVGYLLYSILLKIGLRMNDNIKILNETKDKTSDLISKKHIDGFVPMVRYLAYQKMSIIFQEIKSNLLSEETNIQNIEELISMKEYTSIPQCINHFKSKINIHLSKSIPYDMQKKNILIYKDILSGIPSYSNYQLTLSAIGWLLQTKNKRQALDMIFIKIEQIIFWIGRIPIIGLFHETLADYYLLNQQYQEGLEELKKSNENLVKIFGNASTIVLQGKLNICKILLEINRKQQCLKHLKECKNMCETSQLISNPIYIDILKKISQISLSLSKYNESINCSIASLKYLQANIDNQAQYKNEYSSSQFLEIAELLLRAFQLTNRREELFQITALCVERFVSIDNLKLTRKLFKLLLFPYLKRMTMNQAQVFLLIVRELRDLHLLTNQRQDTLYQYIKERRMLANFSEKLKKYFHNLTKIHEKIINFKEMDEFYSDYELYIDNGHRSQTKLFLIQMYFTINLTGTEFIEAIIKDSFYT